MTTGEFHGKRVLLVGLGRFGGQISAARWLAEQGAAVTVTDLAPAEKLAESLAQLEGLSIDYRLGGHDERDLDVCDLLVVSPAVPKDRSAFIQTAIERGIPISAEMNLLVERCPARRIIGVTGSAGKSTTTAMLGSILATAERAGAIRRGWMGGNIGRSLLSDLAQMRSDDVVVLELSSFQLDDLGPLRWSPPVAVVTNIQPNHLDRHGTMEAYIEAKMNIVRYQQAGDVVIVHEGDTSVCEHIVEAGAKDRIQACRFDARFADDLVVPGEHNRLNAAAAVAAARAVGLGDEYIAHGLRGFAGLPHRLAMVGEVNGVRYYNDSKSTTPESACIAARAFTDRAVTLVVGGRPKGTPFAAMAAELTRCCRRVICYGEAGPEIHREMTAAIGAAAASGTASTAASAELLPTFTEAVRRAKLVARPGEVVVLSPACASYDEFINYEQRGEAFARLVGER